MSRVSKKSKTASKVKKPAAKKPAERKPRASKNKAAVVVDLPAPVVAPQQSTIEALLIENNKLLRGVISAIANLNPGQVKQSAPVVVQETHGNGGSASVNDFLSQPAQPSAPRQVITKDQITEALQKISADHGLDAVKAVLVSFNANRISDIPEDQYPAFLAKCSEYGVNTAADLGGAQQPASTSFL